MTPAPKRRWSYSLRTLFVVVTVGACWLGYYANWARQRHQFLGAQRDLARMFHQNGMAEPVVTARAPGALWLLGERGVGALGVLIVVDRLDDFDNGFDWESHETMRTARRLFPEADIGFGVMERQHRR
jgi:hypothetical protein